MEVIIQDHSCSLHFPLTLSQPTCINITPNQQRDATLAKRKLADEAQALRSKLAAAHLAATEAREQFQLLLSDPPSLELPAQPAAEAATVSRQQQQQQRQQQHQRGVQCSRLDLKKACEDEEDAGWRISTVVDIDTVDLQQLHQQLLAERLGSAAGGSSVRTSETLRRRSTADAQVRN